MDFRDYAARETSALVARLLAAQSDASVAHLRVLREAVDAAVRTAETAGAATPEIERDVQELLRRLTSAASAAARAAAQRVQEDARIALGAAEAQLQTERTQNEELATSLAEAQAIAESLRADLRRETERADQADRDLDAAIEAHRQVDASRLEAEASCREQSAARSAAEDELRDVRGLLEDALAQSDRLSYQLDAETAMKALVEADLASERDANIRFESDLIALRATNEQLESDLVAARSVTAELESDLSSARDVIMQLKIDLSAAEDARSQLEADLAALRETSLQLEIDLSAARGASTQAEIDLAAARDTNGQLAAAVARAEAATTEETEAKAALETRLRDVRAALDSAVAEVARLGMQIEASAAENAALAADLHAARDEREAARAERVALAAQLATGHERVQALESTQDELVRQLESRLEAALEAETRYREEAVNSDVEVALSRSEITTLRGDVEKLTALLDASAQSVEDLARETTVSGILAALVTQLSEEFPRVAVFRVKGNRLEGEHQSGFDPSTDVTKLVIPSNMDSLLTRAASSGVMEHLKGNDLDDSSRAPFGGTPHSAVALPIAFQGEPLAVVYADDSGRRSSDRGPAAQDASVAFARLLVRQATAAITRLSQELKTLAELREYAALLIQEAEQMYAADTQVGMADDERRRRLEDTIECARQLYAQRAAMEGPAAASLLDERIAATIEGQPESAFGQDLGAISGIASDMSSSRRTAS